MTGERTRPAWWPLVRVLRVVLLAYVGFLLLMMFTQSSYIYYPDRAAEEVLLEHGRRQGLSPWRDQTGQLIGWHTAQQQPAANRIVLFHGNAGYALHRLYFVRGMRALETDDARLWDVYLFEYPGYGARAGRPSESAIMEAAAQAVGELVADGGAVFLAGESLGSGVASALASQNPEQVPGVFLITPFNNLAAVASHHFPFLPVRLLLRERYDSEAALKDYRGAMAMLLAEHDEIVPARLGQKVFDAHQGLKKLWMQTGATHNTLDFSINAPFWQELSEFLLEHAGGTD